MVFGHRKPTQWTHSDEIRRVSVDVRSALAHQIWPTTVKGGRYRSPQKSKCATNCGFWPPEANTMNTCTWNLAWKPSTSPSLPPLALPFSPLSLPSPSVPHYLFPSFPLYLSLPPPPLPSASWRVRHRAKPVAVRIECCRMAGILGQKVRTHHSVTLWTPLVESSRDDKVSALCSGFLMPSWYSTTVSRRDFAYDNQPQFLQSAATSTPIVPATWWRILGDRAFPVAAARAWNSLPSFVRDEQSLVAFRWQLKTVLFRTSFGEDGNTSAASLLTHECLVFVRWPCHVLCVIMPP